MDGRYRQELRRIAEGLPAGPCVVALAAAEEMDRSAAMASDLATEVARRRTGHTILFSLESAPATLDHELGVESELGLRDALAGRVTVRDVAAPSGPRGFIYVPAGASPAPAARVLGSPAWHRIAASALERRATLLLFLDAGALPAESAGMLDGVVLLGGTQTPETRGVPVLGRLSPPRLVPRASRVAKAGEEPEPFRPVLDPRARVVRRRHGTPQSRVIGITVIIAVVIALAAIAVAVVATSGSEPGHAAELVDLP